MFQTSHLLEHRLTARAHGNLEQLCAGLPATALVDQFYADVQKLGGGRWDTSSLLKRLES